MTAKRLSTHQQRVLAALLALEQAHGWSWWSRDTIGHVVAAGGYHGTIQRKTMAALKAGGLVQTERSSWPEAVRTQIRCTCACCMWGLTGIGRERAQALKIRWPEDATQRVQEVRFHDHSTHWTDEDEPPPGWRGFDDDDDDDDGNDGSPTPAPVGSPALVCA